jgi:putative sporulation protein YyaC
MGKPQSIRSFAKSNLPYRIEYTSPQAKEIFSQYLFHALLTLTPCRELVCICIGTDRSTGDSLGPLVGSLLSKDTPPHIHIYGTLEEPVHALNLLSIMQRVQKKHPDAHIIAIDACLGQYKNVGLIQVGLGPVRPGAGVNKDLPEIGQVHVTGIVNVSGFMEYFVLQNTRLSLVMKMAEVISASILCASKQLQVS